MTPGGHTLPRAAPLLLTLAFLLPATTGALPVIDEAPWTAWYTERVMDEKTAWVLEGGIALKSNGDPVVAYVTSANQGSVAIAERINGQWVRTFTPGTFDPSLAIDPDDTIHLTHREGYATSWTYLGYSARVNGVWTTEVIHNGILESPSAPIDLDSQGYPHIVYATSNHPNPGTTIHHAYKDSNGWHHETIDPAATGGPRTDIAVDNQDRVHVVYTDVLGPNTHNTHHAVRNPDGTWTETDLPQCANEPTIDTDSTGTPHIACTDGDGLVYYTQINGEWVREVVDNGCEGDLILCRAPYESGEEPSLQVDDQDRPHIVYRYQHVWDGTEPIWQTHPLYTIKADGKWHVETIDRDGWHHGYQPDIKLDDNGVPHVFYVTGWETAPAGTKGAERPVYATPLAPHVDRITS